MCLFSFFLYCRHYLVRIYVPLFSIYTTITTCSLYFFTLSVDLYNGDRQTTTVLFTRNFTQGWLNSYYSSFALSGPFIVVEHSCFRFLKSSIATPFLFVYCVHIASCCVRLRCILVIYLFHTHTDVIVGLLITTSMYILMWLLFIVFKIKRYYSVLIFVITFRMVWVWYQRCKLYL